MESGFPPEILTYQIDRPTLGPDLNPIENIQNILTREVYKNLKQCDSIKELKLSFEKAWFSLSPIIFQKPMDSMEILLFEAIQIQADTISQ